MKVVILAGGSGTRLWPVSRGSTPKQVQPFIDDETLLQKTYRRLRRGFDVGDVYVATGNAYGASVREQLPELPAENLFLEPCKRDTAAAIGLTATRFYFHNPREIMVTVHSDHYIDNEDEYLRILKLAGSVIEHNPTYGGLVGLKPTYPETGYGYIKMNGQFAAVGRDEVFTVESFVEKPDRATAEQLITQWEYLWNPGYFVWRVDTLLARYRTLLQDTYSALVAINRSLATEDEVAALTEHYATIQPTSFDYGILEKTNNLLVVPADFTFTDIGNWRTIKDVLQRGSMNNITKGTIVNVDSSNNLIYNFTKHPVAVAGLRDTIVIATPDATLVCHQDNAQDTKIIVEELKREGFDCV